MGETKGNKRSMLLLSGILFLSCLLIFKDYLFGGKFFVFMDIGADTYDQYMMQYQTIIHHIKEGSFSLWDFNNGFGVNMYSLSLYDPFVILVCLYGVLAGAEQIYGIMVWLQIAKILLAGLASYGFLSCFALSERSKLLSAYAYALCGYMVVWGQHYQFGTIVILFPLLLMAAEKSFSKTIWLLYLTVLCAVSCACTLYFSYMQFLVLGFYVLFRAAWKDRILCKNSLVKIGKIYGSMLLGIGMGLFQLLPSASLIFGVSGRVGGGSLAERILGALKPYDGAYYASLMKHFLSGNLQGINDYSGYLNYYEDPNVYLSVLLLFAGVQFLYFVFRGKDYSRKQKILLAVSLLLCAFVLLIPAGSLIFNGFSYPFSRHTFLCMPFFAWIMAYALNEILEHKKICSILLILTLLPVAFEYGRIFIAEDRTLAVCLGIVAVGMAACLGGSVWLKRKLRDLSMGALALALAASMVLDAWYSYTSQRVTLTKTSTEYFNELYSPSVKAALEYLKETDESFYRVEKDYTIDEPHSTLNSLAQNYSGVSTYNSTLNTNTVRFLSEFWPELQVVDQNHYSFAGSINHTIPASFCHVKYVLSKKSDFPVPGYEPVKQFGDIYVYRNRNTADAGKYYTSAIRTEDYEKHADMIDKDALLSGYVLCDTAPEITLEQEIIDSRISGENGKIPESADTAAETGNLTSLSEGIAFEACEKDSVVTGTAHVSEKGILMLPIPYENGWHAYVDGEEQAIHQVNYGFSGICLEDGDHEIRMVFKCPGFAAGVAGSILSVLCTAAIWITVRLKNRKRKTL